MLSVNTPVSRIRLERFGKSSIVLARCEASATGPAPDQSAYEPIVSERIVIVADYRARQGRLTRSVELAHSSRCSRSET